MTVAVRPLACGTGSGPSMPGRNPTDSHGPQSHEKLFHLASLPSMLRQWPNLLLAPLPLSCGHIRICIVITVPSKEVVKNKSIIFFGSMAFFRDHRRTQAIRGWPGPSVDGLVSVDGLAFPTKTKTF